MFPYIENDHPNWLSYFSEGFKPPTRKAIETDDDMHFKTIGWKGVACFQTHIFLQVCRIWSPNSCQFPWRNLRNFGLKESGQKDLCMAGVLKFDKINRQSSDADYMWLLGVLGFHMCIRHDMTIITSWNFQQYDKHRLCLMMIGYYNFYEKRRHQTSWSLK